MNWIALGIILATITMTAVTRVREVAVGDLLPQLRGKRLTGQTAILPQAASGRVALLILGFTYESRFSVEAWTKRFRQEFAPYGNVTFYEIPMIGGLGTLARWFIDSGMRRGTPKADQGNVITVYGGIAAWKQRVGFRDTNTAYLILLDKHGNVAWRYAGNIEEEPYRAVSSKVSVLLSGN
jgi:hypothetical protein